MRFWPFTTSPISFITRLPESNAKGKGRERFAQAAFDPEMKLTSTPSHSHHMVSRTGLITDRLLVRCAVSVVSFVALLVIGVFPFIVGRDGTHQEDTYNREKKCADCGYYELEPTPLGCSEEQACSKNETLY
jgi:hypothetical protein